MAWNGILGEICVFPDDMDVGSAVRRRLNGLRTALRTQMEFYFSQTNWDRESFLKRNLQDSEDGWIALQVPLAFPRLAQLLKGFAKVDAHFVMSCLEASQVVEVDFEKEMIRRRL